jgi:hypothetical protein
VTVAHASRRLRRVGNERIAEVFERVADLLEAQQANAFRVRAYREGAATARAMERPLVEVLAEGGRPALIALPAIGRTLASHVAELAASGRLSLLERLEGALSVEERLATVPGIGTELAARIHTELGVETLEELEQAAHDGRLERVPGFGPRRVRAVRELLSSMLRRSSRLRALGWQGLADPSTTVSGAKDSRPGVAALLDVDAEYRRRASREELPCIAPRRFNPERAAWLPVLHATREGWDLTVLFSNTARAHELGATRDWVVVYFERDGEEGQCTVVTERRGALAGRRVVRGREAECATLAARGGAKGPSMPSGESLRPSE